MANTLEIGSDPTHDRPDGFHDPLKGLGQERPLQNLPTNAQADPGKQQIGDGERQQRPR